MQTSYIKNEINEADKINGSVCLIGGNAMLW